MGLEAWTTNHHTHRLTLFKWKVVISLFSWVSVLIIVCILILRRTDLLGSLVFEFVHSILLKLWEAELLELPFILQELLDGFEFESAIVGGQLAILESKLLFGFELSKHPKEFLDNEEDRD